MGVSVSVPGGDERAEGGRAEAAAGWQFNCKKWLENTHEKQLENPLQFPLDCTLKRDLFSTAIAVPLQLAEKSA